MRKVSSYPMSKSKYKHTGPTHTTSQRLFNSE